MDQDANAHQLAEVRTYINAAHELKQTEPFWASEPYWDEFG